MDQIAAARAAQNQARIWTPDQPTSWTQQNIGQRPAALYTSASTIKT